MSSLYKLSRKQVSRPSKCTCQLHVLRVAIQVPLIWFAILSCSKPNKLPISVPQEESETLKNAYFFLTPRDHFRVNVTKYDVDPTVLISEDTQQVKEVLLRIKKSDQSRRDSLHLALEANWGNYDSPEVRECGRQMYLNDSINRLVLRKVFSKYGWPSIQTFGDSASDAAYLVLIHSDLEFQQSYIVLMEKALEVENASPLKYAILVDRIRYQQGRKQLYGTHGRLSPNSGDVVLLPIENEKQVNERRIRIGLPKLTKKTCEMLINW